MNEIPFNQEKAILLLTGQIIGCVVYEEKVFWNCCLDRAMAEHSLSVSRTNEMRLFILPDNI